MIYQAYDLDKKITSHRDVIFCGRLTKRYIFKLKLTKRNVRLLDKPGFANKVIADLCFDYSNNQTSCLYILYPMQYV